MTKKILLVDDDTAEHLVVVPILSKAGYIVISAKNGEQGLDLALKERPDLILLDVILPGIKGRELCQKIKSYEVTKDIPVIFLTVKSSEDDIKAEMKSGGVAHITKPVNPADLLKTIGGLIGS